MEAIKVLAVDDPAVQGYVKPEYDILGRYGKPVVFFKINRGGFYKKKIKLKQIGATILHISPDWSVSNLKLLEKSLFQML